VGLCDLNRPRGAEARRQPGTDAPTGTGLEEMVRATRLDTVIVTTVEAHHSDVMLR
jgi:predicted dehydrogenase